MDSGTRTPRHGLLSVERDLLGYPRLRWNLRPYLNRLILRLLDDETLRRALAKSFVNEYVAGQWRGRGAR